MEITDIVEGLGIDIHFNTRNNPYVLMVESKDVTFRLDLVDLVRETQRDINSDQWQAALDEFKRRLI